MIFKDDVEYSSLLKVNEEEEKVESTKHGKESPFGNDLLVNLSFKEEKLPVERTQRKRELKAQSKVSMPSKTGLVERRTKRWTE